MERRPLAKAAVAVVLLGVAAFLVIRGWGRRGEPGEQAFFYDLSAQEIFRADRMAVPPIRGVDGPELDGFRATVFSPSGRPNDRGTWKVAYLERFSPELKSKMEAAQHSGEALAMGRVTAQDQRFIRRLTDTDWHPLSSPEAEIILNEWTKPQPDGSTPVLCTP